MAKPHLPHPTDAALTLCGLTIAGPWPRPLPIVDTPDTRMCRRCARAYMPSEPPVDSTPYVPSIGARELTARAAREIERSRRGEDPVERQWPTAEAAVRSLMRMRLDGVSVRSTSDPSRAHRVQSSRDPSLGGREHARVDAHRTVSLALDRAEASLDVEHACPGLTRSQAIEVYVWRVVGRVVLREVGLRGQPRKGRVADWIGMPGAEAALHASEVYGVEVTERHVSRIVRHFSGAVRDALVASGEMRASAKDSDRESDMAVRGFELSGWEQIEAYTGIGRDVLRRLVARETDPIPVKQIEGVRGYHARRADLDAWIARNERHAAAAS